MFGIGMPEMILILAIALIVIGPKKLPDLAKSLGRAMNEFKKATREIKESMDIEGDLQDVKKSLDDLNTDVKVVPHRMLLRSDNALDIIEDYDVVKVDAGPYVIEATDGNLDVVLALARYRLGPGGGGRFEQDQPVGHRCCPSRFHQCRTP